MIHVLTIEARMKVPNCCLECGVVLELGMFPFCHGDPDAHTRVTAGRGADVTWPGGKTFENLGDTPQMFYSPAEKARYLRQHGIEEYVRHQPVPGSDKSPHTVSWAAISQHQLDGARAMLERVGSGSKESTETWVRSFEPHTEVGVTTVRGRL